MDIPGPLAGALRVILTEAHRDALQTISNRCAAALSKRSMQCNQRDVVVLLGPRQILDERT